MMALVSSLPVAHGQKQSMKALTRDSLDGAFDFSDVLIYQPGGFLPVPFLVTEPAFGGFGIGLAPIFIKRRPPVIDTMKSGIKTIRTPPNITGGVLLYTANKSWVTMAFRSGTWLKRHIKYRVGGGFANINLAFYRTDPTGTERRYNFNFQSTPILLSAQKMLRGSHWSWGLQYMFLRSRLKPVGGELPDFVRDKEIKSVVSQGGPVVELDSRDNVFTPDQGFRLHTSMMFSNEAIGSNYNYSNLDIYAVGYKLMSRKVVGGLRYETQQVFGDAPFYLLPSINLRGMPIARYQGKIFSAAEAEVRWDFTQRWSLVGFAGSGKAYNAWSEFSSTAWKSSGGGGFRYLMARKFKLRMGMDLARGPEQWAYYIVFGSSWNR
jgi:hypothetical protein